MSATCPACGQPVKELWKKCPYCGAELKQVQSLWKKLAGIFNSRTIEGHRKYAQISNKTSPDKTSANHQTASNARRNQDPFNKLEVYDQLKWIERASVGGNKIGAIRYLRMMTKMGLKEAKVTIEYYERHKDWPFDFRRAYLNQGSSVEQSQMADRVDGNCEAEIKRLLEQNKKINAIKVYREWTGAGLKDSLEAVEYFQEHNRWP